MNTYNKEKENSEFRIVIDRPGDPKNFLEAVHQETGKKRNKFNYVVVDLSTDDLIELRNFLNEVV